MAERIVSPGVFTRERDLSFLPQAIGAIGAAIVGPTQKGPAFIPTQVTSFTEFREMFGDLDDKLYTPFTAEQYLKSAGVVTIVRVLGIGGYKSDSISLQISGGIWAGGSDYETPGANGELTGSAFIRTLAVLTSGRGSSGVANISGSLEAAATKNSFTLNIAAEGLATTQHVLSFDTGSDAYITKVLPTSPEATLAGDGTTVGAYVYKVFKHAGMVVSQSANGADTIVVSNTNNGLDFESGATSLDSAGNGGNWDGNKDFQYARTPYITGQLSGANRIKMFRIYSRSHGTNVNGEFKVCISNIRPASDFPDSDFGTFSIEVRKNASDDFVLESFNNLTIDASSPNYFAKRIGDRHITIDSNGKLTTHGTLANQSKYIRVSDFEVPGGHSLQVKDPSTVPLGHDAVFNPVPGTTAIPTASFKRDQLDSNGQYEPTAYYGFDYTSEFVKDDNDQYLAPIPATANVGSNVTMSIENMLGDDNANINGESTFAGGTTKISLTNSTIAQRRFTVPMQFGFDGSNPATPVLSHTEITSANTQGFDLSSATASGSVAYKRALNAISNPDEFDINLLVTPGVIHRLHPSVTNHAISKVESRADALYIMDSAAYDDSVETVINTVKQLDSNYVATYYPWVLIPNSITNLNSWVPPSTVLPGVIAFTDQVSHEWFAPAGLSRGGLTDVLQAKTRLTHAERDDLYDGRINPIASFPGQGVVVFGQKTLQAKPSALDRINVRRLLIALRKFIASTSQFLVFEQNTQALRNRFLNVVNPYLEQVQQNSGLSAFRVVMDDSNNTPDVVDRNQLVGQIFIQPTRTAEFIVLDFVVQPTGATFPE